MWKSENEKINLETLIFLACGHFLCRKLTFLGEIKTIVDMKFWRYEDVKAKKKIWVKSFFAFCGQFFCRKSISKIWKFGQNKKVSSRCENVKTKKQIWKSYFFAHYVVFSGLLESTLYSAEGFC